MKLYDQYGNPTYNTGIDKVINISTQHFAQIVAESIKQSSELSRKIKAEDIKNLK